MRADGPASPDTPATGRSARYVVRMIIRRRESVYRFIVRTGQAAIRALRADVRVEGLENLPPARPAGPVGAPRFRPVVPGTGAVVAITHSSLLDFVFAEWAIFRHHRVHMRFMIAKRYSGSRFMRAINGWCGHIVVDRGNGAASFAEALGAVRRGDWVAMFPEGSRNLAVRPHALRTGAARLAATTGAPIVPVAVFGGGRLLGGSEGLRVRRLWRAPVSLVVGEPLRVALDEDAHVATERLRAALGAALDRAIETFPAALPAGAPWVPADLGGGAPTVEEAQERWEQRRAERELRG